MSTTAMLYQKLNGSGDTIMAEPQSSHLPSPDPKSVRAAIEKQAYNVNGTMLYMVTADQLVELIEEPKELGAALAAARTIHHYRKRIEPDTDSRFISDNDTVKTITVLGYDTEAAKKFRLFLSP